MALETQVEKKGGAALVDRLLGILEVEGDRLEAENAKLTEANKLLTAEIKAKENRQKELDTQVKLKADQNTAELGRLASLFETEKARLEKDVVPLQAIVKQLQGQIDNSHREIARIADTRKEEIRKQTKDAQADLDQIKAQLQTAAGGLVNAKAQLAQLAQAIQKAL